MAIASAERLEPRQMLAFDYLGITTTNVPPFPTTQAYQYNFELYNDGPNDNATMYLRHVSNINRLQFGYDTAFGSLNDLGQNYDFAVIGAPLAVPPGDRLPSVGSPNVYATGPVSLAAVNSPSQWWRALPPNPPETFVLSKVYVRVRPGTVNPSFVLHVGDDMPLALTVDFSQAANNSGTIIINSSASETYSTAAPASSLPNDQNAAGATLSRGAGYTFLGSEIRIQAALNPRFSNDYRAHDLIRIENQIKGGLAARVSSGDFELVAGGSVTGSTNVQTGGGVPPSASTNFEAYGYGGNGGDISIDGKILNASTVVLQTFSTDPRTIRTGPSGIISGTGSVTLNNASADGGIINVETENFTRHNVFAGSVSNPAADIGITVRQTTGNLTVDALPASRGKIDLQATQADKSVSINSNFDTIGALALTASILNVARPLSTAQGDITLTGNTVEFGSNVVAGKNGIGDLVVRSTTGDVNIKSAAVVQAPGGTIQIDAAASIASDATLGADRVTLTASGAIRSRLRTARVTASAGGNIELHDEDGLIVEQLRTTAAGAIDVTAQGLLDVVDVAMGGVGDVVFATSAGGLVARDIRSQQGQVTLRATDGDIQAVGDVIVSKGKFSLEASLGNIIMSPNSTFSVSDELRFNAPVGRVLTPGVIEAVEVTPEGSGYTSAPAVSLDAGTGATVAPQVGSGEVTFVRVVAGGSGYVTPPAVVFANSGTGGSGAVATAVLQNGSVVRVDILNGGSSYSVAPMISFVGGGGSSAQAEATINGLTALAVTAEGSGYAVPPTVLVSSGDGARSNAVTVNQRGEIQGIVLSQSGAGYNAAPAVVISDSSGSGFGAQARAILSPVGVGGITAAVVTSGGAGYPAYTSATVLVAANPAASGSGRVLLGLTNDSISSVPVGGTGYRVGDLLTVMAGSGASVKVRTVNNGAVQAVDLLNGGRNYSVGDVLYLDDPSLGATGLRLNVTGISTGGVITQLAPDPSFRGTGYTDAITMRHQGGVGGILRVTGVTAAPTRAITSVVVERAGSGYTTRPSAVVGGSGQGATLAFVDDEYTVVGYEVIESGSTFAMSGVNRPTIDLNPVGTVPAALQATVTRVVTGIQVQNAGTGYQPETTTVRLIPAAAGGGATSQAVTVNGLGGITAINVAAPGGGYVADPRVTIVDRSGSGFGAAATAITSNGVTSISLTASGSGYTSAPDVLITGGGGTGATAVASISGGFVTGITILNPGSGYTSAPSIQFVPASGQPGSGATASAEISKVVTDVVLTSSGSGYDPATTDVTLDPIGSGAAAVANLTDGRVTSIRITDNGSGYDATLLPKVTIVPFGVNGLVTATLSNTQTGSVGSVTVTAPGSNYAVSPRVVFSPPGGTGQTAGGKAVVGGVAQLSAASLSWTALEQPLDALLGQFSTANIVLTGAGDLDVRSANDLTLTGAETKDGSIRVAAQKLTVTGAVIAGDFSGSRQQTVRLEALGGDLTINSPVTAPAAVELKAQSGAIIGSTAGVVSTRSLAIAALGNVTLETAVDAVRGGVSGSGAGVTITERNAIALGELDLQGKIVPLSATNGAISVTNRDGDVSVLKVDAGGVGSVAITAKINLVESSVSPSATEIVAGKATLVAQSGRVDLDTSVQQLTASSALSTVTIDDLGAGPLVVESVSARGEIQISSQSTMSAKSVASTDSGVLLKTTGNAHGLLVGAVSALKGVVTLESASDVGHGTLPGEVTATGARIKAGGAVVSLRTKVGTLGATAVGPVQVLETDGITLGETGAPTDFARVQSGSGDVSVKAAGLISALKVIAPQGNVTLESTSAGIGVGDISAGTASGLVTLTAAQSINDNDPAVAVTGFRAALASTSGSIGAPSAPLDLKVSELSATATAGTVDIAETDALVITGVTTTAALIKAAGAISQTGAITATTLAVSATAAGAVTLGHVANDVLTLTGGTTSGTFTYVDANGFSVGALGISAGGPGADNSDISLTATSGDLKIAGNLTALGDRITLAAPAGTITQKSGTITANILDWTAQKAPDFTSLNVNILGLNLTGPGDLSIGKATQNITVASASTADGSITIDGLNVTIDGLVQVGGVGKAATIKADGSLLFQNTGRIVNASATGTVALTSGTTLLASNSTTVTTVTAGGTLAINAGGATSLKTDVGTLSATVAAGGLTIADAGTLAISGISAAGQNVALTASTGITQTGAIVASFLSASSTSGGVILQSTNDVSSVFGSTSTGDFRFANADGFLVTGVSAGVAGADDGSIELVAATGDLELAGDLMARDDTVTLRAPQGMINQIAGVITADTLVWEARSASFNLNNQIDALGINLTAAGDIRYPSVGIFPGTLRIAEVTTVDGNIEILAENLRISGLVRAGGADSTVVVTATTGGIVFLDQGRVVVEHPAGGNVWLSAQTGISATTAAGVVNVTTPAVLNATAPSGGIGLLRTDVGGVTASASGDIAISDSADVSVAGVVTTAGTVTISASGSITNVGSTPDVTAVAAVLTAGSAITLDLDVGTVNASAGGTITLTELDAVTLASVLSTAGSVVVTSGAALAATAVSAAAGNVSLVTKTGGIVVGTVTAGTASGTATITSAAGITNDDAAVDLTASRAVLTAAAGSIALDLAVRSVSASAPGAITLSDTDGLTLTSVVSTGGSVTVTTVAGDIAVVSVSAATTVGAVTLNAAGGITDVDPDVDITAASANLVAGTAGISADLAVATITAIAPGPIDLSDADAVTLTSITSKAGNVLVTAGGLMTAMSVLAPTGTVSLTTSAGNISIGSITSTSATISAAGSITDGDAAVDLTATSATLNAGTGSIDLDLAVASVGGSAASAITISNANAITLSDLRSTSGDISVSTATGGIAVAGLAVNTATGVILLKTPDGAVTQPGGPVTAAVLEIDAPAAPVVNLSNTGNVVTTLQTSIGSGVLSMANGGALSVVADAGLSIARVVAQGNLTVSTPGNLVIGPPTSPYPVLESTTQLDLRDVDGTITLINRGQLVAPTVLLNPANPVVDVGGSVTTTDGLNEAVRAINLLPVLPGATYQIVIGADVTLSDPLVLNRPVALSGSGFTVTGSERAQDGVVINSGASGSRISSLAFAGFSGTAVRVDSATNVSVDGISVSNSGTGLWISGNGSGSTVKGSRLVNNDVAIRIGANRTIGATGVTFGGRSTTERNVIEGARQAGVLATGFSTGTKLIGTTFTANPRTRVRFNVRSSRGLQIQATTVQQTPVIRFPIASRVSGRESR